MKRMSTWVIVETIAGSVVASIGGVGLLFRYAGDFLLARTKAKWDRELEKFKDTLNTEQRRYQAQLDRSIFVSRVHFDTEFQAIKEVHQCLSEVKIHFRSLFPINAKVIVTDEKRNSILQSLQQANERYITKLEEWGVFLEPAQYDEFKRCNDAIEYLLEVFPKRATELVCDDITRERFCDSYRAACQTARDRIAKLAVIPQ